MSAEALPQHGLMASKARNKGTKGQNFYFLFLFSNNLVPTHSIVDYSPVVFKLFSCDSSHTIAIDGQLT